MTLDGIGKALPPAAVVVDVQNDKEVQNDKVVRNDKVVQNVR